MNSKKKDIKSEDNVYLAGYYGFEFLKLEEICEVSKEELIRQFKSKSGDFYERYSMGRFTSEIDIRKAVFDSAENGSNPAILKAIEYFSKSERLNIEIYE